MAHDGSKKFRVYFVERKPDMYYWRPHLVHRKKAKVLIICVVLLCLCSAIGNFLFTLVYNNRFQISVHLDKIIIHNEPRRSEQPEQEQQQFPADSPTTTTSTTTKRWTPRKTDWIIDMISIGSMTRPHYQQAQRATFGSHPAVRNFWSIREFNDTERDCATKLTLQDVRAIQKHCSRAEKPYPTLQMFNRLFTSRQYLKKKGNPAGWLCAQKRPIDALYAVLTQYISAQRNGETLQSSASRSSTLLLPHYLFLLDDDTYVNMPAVLQFLQSTPLLNDPDEQARIIAGCLSRLRGMNISFAYGGWGTYFSRRTLQRWIQPLYCDTNATTNKSNGFSNEEFENHACWRLQQNEIGERSLYRYGDSLIELLYRYTMEQPYRQFASWKENTNRNKTPFYCFHSDTAFAYFANYYRLAQHAGLAATTTTTAKATAKMGSDTLAPLYYDEDRLLGYNGSLRYAGQQRYGARAQKRQCWHRNDTFCTSASHLCHYVTPEHMRALYNQQPPHVL